MSNSRPTSRISDIHVQIPMSGGQASYASSADSKDTSSSLLDLLFWNIAVFTSIQFSRYGSLANSFIDATPAIITCRVWRFNGVFRVWARGVSFTAKNEICMCKKDGKDGKDDDGKDGKDDGKDGKDGKM
jgi:hypothetical protein